jgi:hypothetical protein
MTTAASEVVYGDSCVMKTIAETSALSPAQERFAEASHATTSLGCAAHHMVCLYSEQGGKTKRWIVSEQGGVVDYEEFGHVADSPH